MDKPTRWHGVGRAVGMMLNGIGLVGTALSVATGKSLIPGLDPKWAYLVFAVLLVGTCWWWVLSTHRRYHKFCDSKTRRATLYRETRRLRGRGESLRERLLSYPNTAEVPDIVADDVRRQATQWWAEVVEFFKNTDWQEKMAEFTYPTSSAADVHNFLSFAAFELQEVLDTLDSQASS